MHFPRVCVTVDISQKLELEVPIKARAYKIIYENLHNLCLVCGVAGHKTGQCTTTAEKEKAKQVQGNPNHKGGRTANKFVTFPGNRKVVDESYTPAIHIEPRASTNQWVHKNWYNDEGTESIKGKGNERASHQKDEAIQNYENLRRMRI
uniref:Uncharacterized protein n=1 Tax=Nelumbo nucifera TaxID=4432 RepID=A0A822YX87_NELNU|nr:TPA_asm: hypothetical protein HUJ06_012689 [Nelumbo nucifera]